MIVKMSDQELINLFIRYGRMKDTASVEGLGRIASNISLAFSDFVSRVGSNIKSIVSSTYKDINRSSLQQVLQANKASYIHMFSSGSIYDRVVALPVPAYPFTVSPKEVGDYCRNTFAMIIMHKRIIDIIESYRRLASAIRAGNVGEGLLAIQKLDVFNMPKTLSIKPDLIRMVAGKGDDASVEFGKLFNSMTEYKEAVEITASCSIELELAIKTAKILDQLYKAFDQLQASIEYASSTSFDIGKFSGIVNTISATGELIESYGLLCIEYHHLEYHLSKVTEAVIRQSKK